MPSHQTGVTHYHAQLGLPHKGGAIKELVLSYIVWIRSMKGLRTCARCVGMVPCCGQNGYLAQVPQQPKET